MWRALGSARLAIGLMVAIVGASVVGTVVKPERAGELVYGTPWFRGAVALLCLNIVACTLSRGRVTMLRLGSFLAHLSVLLILGGALYGLFEGRKGTLMMEVGDTLAEVPTADGGQFPLGFQVRLDDFKVERDCHGTPARLTAALPDKGEVASVEVKQGVTVAPPGTDYQFTILAYYPDFVLGDGAAQTRSPYPNNPAVQLLVKDGATEKKCYVFQRHPEFNEVHGGAGSALAFELDAGEAGRIKQFRSRLTFLEGGRTVGSEEIWVNHPARHGGFTFYQSSYDEARESWTGLQVVKDPGVPVVYAGFAVQIAGVVLIIFLNPILRARLRAGRAA